jgi:hypothetical protein
MNTTTRIAAGLIALAALTSSASAAKIGSDPCTKQDCFILSIEGKIEYKDEDKFLQEAQKYKNGTRAIIMLHSPGGNVPAALAIGRTIRERGYSTYVGDKYICMSSCAMIWLGGINRFYEGGARIGFHAAYLQTKRGAYELGAANAVVGAYYKELGLSDNAIFYLTVASPSQMAWLTVQKASELGIAIVDWNAPPKPRSDMIVSKQQTRIESESIVPMTVKRLTQEHYE